MGMKSLELGTSHLFIHSLVFQSSSKPSIFEHVCIYFVSNQWIRFLLRCSTSHLPLSEAFLYSLKVCGISCWQYPSQVFQFLTGAIRASDKSPHKKGVLYKAATAPETLLPHQEFRNSLKGQEISIPSLYSLFPEWSPRLHEEYERARDEVINPWLDRWACLSICNDVDHFLTRIDGLMTRKPAWSWKRPILLSLQPLSVRMHHSTGYAQLPKLLPGLVPLDSGDTYKPC